MSRLCRVAMYYPSYSGLLRGEHSDCREGAIEYSLALGESEGWQLVARGRRLHAPVDLARTDFCAGLAEGSVDLLVMMDADQACTPDAPGLPEGAWLSIIVRQYLAGHPRRVLFGVTAWAERDATVADSRQTSAWARAQDGTYLNCQLDTSGAIVCCGTGVMAIGAPAYRRVRDRWPQPWINEPGKYAGEDLLFTRRCTELGIPIEPIRGLRVHHWPEWRNPFTHVVRD